MVAIIPGLAILPAIFSWTIALAVKPDALKIFRRVVCRKDEKMEIVFARASYHQPGEKSVEIYCVNYGSRRVANGRTFLAAFLFSFVLMLPVSFLIVAFFERMRGN